MLSRRRRGSAGLPERGFLKCDALLDCRGWHNVQIDLCKDDAAGCLRYTVALGPPPRLLITPFVLAFWSRGGEVR